MINYEKYASIRDSKGMKDSEVAKRAGIYQSVFSDWKKGKSAPKQDKLIKIAEALEVEYSDFVGNVGRFSSLNPNRPRTITVDPGIDIVVKTMKQDSSFYDRILSYAEFLAKGENK